MASEIGRILRVTYTTDVVKMSQYIVLLLIVELRFILTCKNWPILALITVFYKHVVNGAPQNISVVFSVYVPYCKPAIPRKISVCLVLAASRRYRYPVRAQRRSRSVFSPKDQSSSCVMHAGGSSDLPVSISVDFAQNRLRLVEVQLFLSLFLSL